LPPGCDTALLDNAELPLVITEGGSRRWRSGGWQTWAHKTFRVFCQSASPAFLIGAVRSAKPPHLMASGECKRTDSRFRLDCVEKSQSHHRFRPDSAVKDQVRFARIELAQHLRRQGALVGFLEWDLAHGKGI
jgi:hypothetical protein